jgi:predicted transcriptional regulator of viral defense system
VRDIVGALERDRSVTSQNPDGAMRTLLTRLNRDGRIARAARGQYRSVS